MLASLRALAVPAALVALAAVVAFVAGARAVEGSAAVGAVAAAVVVLLGAVWTWSRRERRATLSAADRAWLADRIPVYASADARGRTRFEAAVSRVLATQGFEAVGEAVWTETAWTPARRLAVAAGAATMLHGRPSWRFDTRRTMLLYAERFDVAYEQDDGEGEFDGMAHAQGPVIFTADALDAAWAWPDGSNVVLHELAHLFDYQSDGADGVPSLLDGASADAWTALVRRETQRIRVGKSLLRSYAATNAAEFFAVATEVFFERPHPLARRHPEVYAALAAMYALDPRDAVQAYLDAHAADMGASVSAKVTRKSRKR